MIIEAYLFDLRRPLLAIRKVSVKRVVCEKTVWAEIASPHNTRRFLFGASAFLSQASAERAQLGYLTKYLKTSGRWLSINKPAIYDAIQKKINSLK